ANLNDAVEAIEAYVGIRGSSDPDSLTYKINALAPAEGVVGSDGSYSAADDDVLKARVEGDDNPRVTIEADGTIRWGSGSAAADVNLYRSNINTLRTDDQIDTFGLLAR